MANEQTSTRKRRRRDSESNRRPNKACLPELKDKEDEQVNYQFNTRSSSTNQKQQQQTYRTRTQNLIKLYALFLTTLSSLEGVICRQSNSQNYATQPLPFSPYSPSGQASHFYHHQLAAAQSTINGPSGGAQTSSSGQVSQQMHKCRIGAPLQWRSYLDAASKAYLAPAVSLATLKHYNLTPIQLVSSMRDQTHTVSKQQQSQFHAQNINNMGVLIEATFQINSVLKRSLDLRPGQLIKLHYKVSASLSTTSDIIALAQSNDQATTFNRSALGGVEVTPIMTTPPNQARHVNQVMHQHRASNSDESCALELTESELVKKGAKLFKRNQDYVLYLDQLIMRRFSLRPSSIQQAPLNAKYSIFMQQQTTAAAAASAALQAPQPETVWSFSWHSFASHELLTNKTARSIHRVLCRNCARAPSVQLVNATFVSTISSQDQQETQIKQQQRRFVKMDCLVRGNPAPWVEWFRNGKLLRNKLTNSQRGVRIRTSNVKQRPMERLSRLELELQPGRNETGVYECRAMSVAAREPAVGTYTLLVLPERQFALIPMQQVTGNGESQRDYQDGNSWPSIRDKTGVDGSATTSSEPRNTTTANLTPPTSGKLAVASGGPVQINEQQQSETNNNNQATATISGGGGGGNTPAAGTQTTSTTTTTSIISTTLPPPTSPQVARHHDDNEDSPTKTGSKTDESTTAAAETQQQQQQQQQQKQQQLVPQQTGPSNTKNGATQAGPSAPSAVVVGQPCPRDAHDNFCLNRGTCVLIGHIEEYFCNCAEGYHGHRCEYKSLGHQQT